MVAFVFKREHSQATVPRVEHVEKRRTQIDTKTAGIQREYLEREKVKGALPQRANFSGDSIRLGRVFKRLEDNAQSRLISTTELKRSKIPERAILSLFWSQRKKQACLHRLDFEHPAFSKVELSH